jgi:hypothetical protein
MKEGEFILSGIDKKEYRVFYRNDEMNGVGVLKLEDNYYIGQVKDGLAEGIGTFVFKNGVKYCGEFYNGHYATKNLGIKIFKDGIFYILEWEDNQSLLGVAKMVKVSEVVESDGTKHYQMLVGDLKKEDLHPFDLEPISTELKPIEECLENDKKEMAELMKKVDNLLEKIKREATPQVFVPSPSPSSPRGDQSADRERC